MAESSERKSDEVQHEHAAETAHAAASENAETKDPVATTNQREVSDTDGSGDSDAHFSAKDPVEIVVKATVNKEEGNQYFKSGDLDKAVRSYRKGTNLLKRLNKMSTGDDQVKSLLVTLQNNLSMVFFKQNKTKVSGDMATRSIAIDPKNVKAYYRRAVARRKMGDLESARDDLKEALKHEPSNTAVKKELVAVKKDLHTFKEQQKKALSAAFTSGAGQSLYGDKEVEKAKIAEAKKEKLEQEKRFENERKKQWEDECVHRMAKKEQAISYDDWKKEKEIEKKEKERKERKARASARKAARPQTKKEDSDSDCDELTPSELAMMRGYKKTADGRVTSYFTREQSEHEKGLIGDITPQRLDSGASPPQLLSSSTGSENFTSAQKGRPSAWNQAGTWEEKETTSWCTDRLRQRLLETKSNVQTKSMERYRASISSVENLTGEASVATTNGKKRYIFDYHVRLKFEVRDAVVEEVLAEGNLHIPDICSTSHNELEVNFTGWKKSPGSAHRENAIDCQHSLILEVRDSVKRWVGDFNHYY